MSEAEPVPGFYGERGTADVFCMSCHYEVKGIRGELSTVEYDEGRFFYPDSPFVCPHCEDVGNFLWHEFWDSNGEAVYG